MALIATGAKGYRVRGIHPGQRAAVLRGRARRIGKGVWTAKLGKSRGSLVQTHEPGTFGFYCQIGL